MLYFEKKFILIVVYDGNVDVVAVIVGNIYQTLTMCQAKWCVCILSHLNLSKLKR